MWENCGGFLGMHGSHCLRFSGLSSSTLIPVLTAVKDCTSYEFIVISLGCYYLEWMESYIGSFAKKYLMHPSVSSSSTKVMLSWKERKE